MNVNGTLFFSAFQPDTGSELWKSDGTEAGTVLVKDISPGPLNSSLTGLINVGGTIFFNAIQRNALYHPESNTGYELWKSDGTEAGTVLVKDIVPGPGSSDVTPLIGINGVLFFSTIDGGLWRSDGTEAGTWLLREHILPGGGLSCGDGFAAVNGTLVFAARDENGCELWRSDGVTADLLMDINPGPGSSMWRRFGVVAQFRSVSGLVLFSAYDDAHGFELWATDGTSNTGMVEDIAVGPGWSSPSSFTPVGSLVFFTANDGMTGTELWAISRSAIHRALNLPAPKASP